MTLSWITVVWSINASACITLGLVHLAIWVAENRLHVHLVFFFIAASIAAIAFGELQLMHAQTPEQFGAIMRWIHVPVFTAVISIVLFVRLYFRAGRLWLAYGVCGLRLLALFLNFYFEPNLNYREITGLRQVEIFAGEYAAVAVGVPNPWTIVGELSSLLLLVFVADASVACWRRGGRLERRRAVVVGGSFLVLVAVAAGSTFLIHAGLMGSVYLISIPFFVVLVAMGVELSADVARLAQLAWRLRESESDLSRSERRMDQAAEAARIGVWEWDMERDEVWVTNRGRALFGFAPTERVDFNRFLKALHPEDRVAVREAVTRSREEGRGFEREYRVIREGEGRWIHTRGNVEIDPSGRATLMRGISFDVTERKQAEELFQRMVEAAPCGIIILDRNGRITLANAQVEVEFGYPVAELRGELIEKLIPERFHASHPAHRDRFFAGPSARTMAGRAVLGRRRDGREIPLEIGLSQIDTPEGRAVLATIVDVSERVQRAEALQAERAFLRQVIDMNPSLIFAKDIHGRFTLVNQAVADVYGTTVEALIGRKHQDFDRSPEESEFFRRMDLMVIETRKERFIPEERITDAAGTVHWLQTVKRPILGHDGTVNQVLGVATDITARKQADLELVQQRNELAHLARVMMLGELSGSLAHELNQPLTAILSNAQAAQRFMASAHPDLDELREILQDIVDDDKRAGEVIQGLRLLLKKGETRHEALDTNEAVQNVLRLVRSDMLNSGVGVVTALAPDLPRVKGDRVQLQQVLLNLVVNGCDAMAGVAASDRRLAVSTKLADAGNIQVCVTDHGRGIPPEDLERVFDSFFTTKPHGLGLGLVVCRKIISAHGGRLWATSSAGDGASFTFTLPVYSDDPA